MEKRSVPLSRLWIDKNKNLWCQCNSKAYGKWVRSKIKKLDFKNKIIKVIDLKVQYRG